MSEPHPSEDSVAQYLLGDLTDAERREFEAELANSAELRSLLRELEESSVLLALSSPQRRAPAKVWQTIEKAVAHDDVKNRKPIPAFWITQTWLGWTAAAVILLGCFFYSFQINHEGTQDISKLSISSETNSSAQIKSVPVAPAGIHEDASSNKKSGAAQIIAADPQELLRLRRQVTELQNRVTNLSQAVAQQHALLGESNRIKFFQVSSASGGNNTAPAPSLSPALQRALFIAMARELGWLPSADPSFSGTNTAFLSGGNIDFVDLRPSANGPPKIVQPQPQPNPQAANQPTPEPAPTPNAAPIAIPAFTSGNNVVVTIDQSIVPAGTQVNFLDQNQQPLGWTTVGDNPIVVTIPTSLGGSLFITAGGFSAPLNTWQISNPVSTNP